MDNCEEKRLEGASAMAGEYIEELGQSDLAQLSYEQWIEFLRRAIRGYEITAPF